MPICALLIAQFIDSAAQLQNARVQVDPVDMQRFAAYSQFPHIGAQEDHVLIKAADVVHTGQPHPLAVFQLQRVRSCRRT